MEKPPADSQHDHLPVPINDAYEYAELRELIKHCGDDDVTKLKLFGHLFAISVLAKNETIAAQQEAMRSKDVTIKTLLDNQKTKEKAQPKKGKAGLELRNYWVSVIIFVVLLIFTGVVVFVQRDYNRVQTAAFILMGVVMLSLGSINFYSNIKVSGNLGFFKFFKMDTPLNVTAVNSAAVFLIGLLFLTSIFFADNPTSIDDKKPDKSKSTKIVKDDDKRSSQTQSVGSNAVKAKIRQVNKKQGKPRKTDKTKSN